MPHPTASAGDVFSATGHWSALTEALELQSLKMHGRGVLEDIELSDEGSFDLGISAGYINTDRARFAAAQVYELPPSVTRYVWIDEDGAVTLTATSAYPGGDVVCLGKVTTDGSGITAISNEGRMLAWWWSDERTLQFGQTTVVFDNLNGWVGVGKEPEVPFHALSPLQGPGLDIEEGSDPTPVAGIVNVYAKAVDGKAELHFGHEDGATVQVMRGAHRLRPVNVETLTGNKQLTAYDHNIQRLTPSGSNREVWLPDSDDIGFGYWFEIHNDDDTLNLLIKTVGGANLIETLTPGQYVSINPVSDTGIARWPDTLSVSNSESPVSDI